MSIFLTINFEFKCHNTNLTHHLKQLEKEQKPKVSRRKETLKIREEINKTKIKKAIGQNPIKSRAGSFKG